MPESITEEMKIHEKWYAEANEQTLETLPDFLKKLTEDYRHDYGTICHAIAAAAIGAAWAVEHSPQGGITGFQASCIMWEIIRHWMAYKGPLKLTKYQDMLYPQYSDKFEKTISRDTWKYLQEGATRLLSEGDRVHPDVKAHWQGIVAGNVPFGYKVEDE